MGKFSIKVLHEEPISRLSLTDIKGGFSCTCDADATFNCTCDSGSQYDCKCNGSTFSCTCHNGGNYACVGNFISCSGASNKEV